MGNAKTIAASSCLADTAHFDTSLPSSYGMTILESKETTSDKLKTQNWVQAYLKVLCQ